MIEEMKLTIKKLADYAGVSVRTLHYYDKVGLMKPESRSSSGYRYYGEDSVLRLQQILFFKELGFSLDDIKSILSQPDFDLLQALQAQRNLLFKKTKRVEELLRTLDTTIETIERKKTMQIKDYYRGFGEEEIEKFREEVRRRWGEKTLEDSEERIVGMGRENFIELQARGGKLFQTIYSNMAEGYDSPFIQDLIRKWREWLENFHHYTDEEVLGLGRAYSQNPDFARFFYQYSDELPQFLTNAIEYYYLHK